MSDPMNERPYIGINIDGALHHDGLPPPDAATRMRMIADARVFDYIEKNPAPGEDLPQYMTLCERHDLPMRVIGGIYRAGRDEARIRQTLAAAAQFGSKVLNCQIHADHADGHRLSDAEIARLYADICAWAANTDCAPSFEVHVDMWSEDFSRIERVAALLARDDIPLRITLDHSHLLFKIGNTVELDASGIRMQVEAGTLVLDPASDDAIFKRWVAHGWVHHAHARSVAPNNPPNARMTRPDGRPGRGIQYPFARPRPGEWHGEWSEAALTPWKDAVRHLLRSRMRGGAAAAPAPAHISCEFIPFPDYGGGARYSIFDNNVACAQWLRDTWHEALFEHPTETPR
jgi:hypothetical protein